MCGYASVCTSARALTAMLFTKSGSNSNRRSPETSFAKPERCGANASFAVRSSVFSPTTCMGGAFALSWHSFLRSSMTFRTRVSRYLPASRKFACVPRTMHPSIWFSSITGFNTAVCAASPTTCLMATPPATSYDPAPFFDAPMAAMSLANASSGTLLTKMIALPGRRWLVISLMRPPSRAGYCCHTGRQPHTSKVRLRLELVKPCFARFASMSGCAFMSFAASSTYPANAEDMRIEQRGVGRGPTKISRSSL
mmetsp:Transcript_13815/g.59113  ORF Transcript_13815/g.59113 Transcript_13815/m.59113 type:complete len:253 (-) Transcript_13815:1542-2300(-)